MAGNINLGGYDAPAAIGQIDNAEFTRCLWVLNLPMDYQMTTPSWAIEATGAPVGGVTPVEITGVGMHHQDVQDPGNPGAQCDYDVAGSMSGTFDNATQTLAINESDGSLAVSNIIGCFGLLTEGAPLTIEADYVIGNEVGPVNIS